MKVYVLSKNVLDAEDQLQMATLGTDQCFLVSEAQAGDINSELYTVILEGCSRELA